MASRKIEVVLSRRALRDIEQIDAYSVETFGKTVADEYIADIDRSIGLLSENPGLLRCSPELSGRLRFYRVRHHFLLCDIIDSRVYILAVVHGNMDLPSRIGELEPQLILETDLLHRRYVDEAK